MPAPTLAPHTPLAAARPGPAGKAAAMMPRLAAITAAAPTPCTTRASTNSNVPKENADQAAPTSSTTSPLTKVRRRPKSSETVPADSRAAPRPTLIDESTQVRPEAPVPSVAAIGLIAASGTVKATKERNVPSAETPSWWVLLREDGDGDGDDTTQSLTVWSGEQTKVP